MERDTKFWVSVGLGMLGILAVLCLMALWAHWGTPAEETPEIDISVTPSDTPEPPATATETATVTAVPTFLPSATPTLLPTGEPTGTPTLSPTETITAVPSETPSPTWPAPYVVERDDYLIKIATTFYGRGNCWLVIYRQNRTVIEEPNLIYKGERLWLPQVCGR